VRVTDTGRGPGRPRRAETDERVRDAALELLRERGPESVNVAAVAARSGVARTTIYRRYTDRRELLRDVLRPLVVPGEPDEDLPVRSKVVWVLARTEEVLAGSIGLGGVAAALTDADPEFSEVLREVLAAALEPLRERVVADMDAGRLTPHADDDDIVINLLLGAYLAEVVRYGAPRRDWSIRTADLLAAILGAGVTGGGDATP
jgi:AcrR family transcriptional regulator